MLVLGLLLILATGAFTAVAVMENFSSARQYPVEIFGNQIATLTPPGLFLSGVALTLIFFLGLAMFSAGLRRQRRVRASASAPAQSTPRQRRGRHIFGH